MELPKPPSSLTSLACFLLLLLTTINQSFSARTFGGLPPSPQPSPQSQQHHHHLKIMTFYMPNMLNTNLQHPQTKPLINNVNSQPIPFSKPLGLFPPIGGIPIYDPGSNPGQTSSMSGVGSGISFSAATILQEELEFGMVNVIDIDLLQKTNLYGLRSFGKAKGMYVASSENERGQMMAMTTSFADNDYRDELRFFGVHQADVNSESHVAIIGGKGKYEGANGYATIKNVKPSSKNIKEDRNENNFVRVNVYLG